jgi:hypothetical protein
MYHSLMIHNISYYIIIAVIPHMHTLYLEQVHPLHYISIPPLLPSVFQTCVVGLTMLPFICVYLASSPPRCPFSKQHIL